jgi:hypothetical protein
MAGSSEVGLPAQLALKLILHLLVMRRCVCGCAEDVGDADQAVLAWVIPGMSEKYND